MRILILDDQKLRHESFAKRFSGHEITSVFRFNEFLAQLDKSWDLILLDHDLGDEIADADTYVDGWGKTQLFNGRHAAMKVCELNDELKPKQVIVHSINASDAPTMRDMLERAGIPVVWEPFSDPDLNTCSWCEKQFIGDNLDNCCSIKCKTQMQQTIEWADKE
jgi:CheY-like chemotaxis protein